MMRTARVVDSTAFSLDRAPVPTPSYSSAYPCPERTALFAAEVFLALVVMAAFLIGFQGWTVRAAQFLAWVLLCLYAVATGGVVPEWPVDTPL